MTKTIDPTKPHATKRDVADHFGVTTRTIENWIADPADPLPHLRRGATVRFRLADVEKYMQKQKPATD